MIKLANKRNLSYLTIAAMLLSMIAVIVAAQAVLLEGMVSQREEKAPQFTFDVLKAQSTAQIRFSQNPLSITFVAEDGKESTILFAEDGVTYSGDVTTAESAKMFFNLFWKSYVLENHLRAKCEGVVVQWEE